MCDGFQHIVMCKVICGVILNAHNSLWCILNVRFFNILICMIIHAL